MHFYSGVDSPVIGGIVGHERYQFDVWGDTVNTASRMTAVGAPGTVGLTYDVWLRVQDDFEGRLLGARDIKGKGKVEVVECSAAR